MAAILTPNSDHGRHDQLVHSDPAQKADSWRTGHHALIILHVEYDTDETLLEFAGRVGDADHVTLANIRPTAAPFLPPSAIMSDLGAMVYLDTRDVHNDQESHLDLRVSARSRLLHELGIEHEVITETYHRSVVTRVTQRGLRKAIGRVARRARADEVLVGPGAILESQKLD